ATAIALAAVVTGLSSIDCLGGDRQSRGNAGDAELVAGLLDEELVTARTRWRVKAAVRMIAQSFIRAEYADQLIDFIVIRAHILIRNGPIFGEAVFRLALEVVGAETE